jgi:hypothetical protein
MSRFIRRSVLASLLASAAAFATACYKTPQPECAFACEFGGTDSCPSGYSCRPDNLCKLEGIADGFACPDTVDAASVDTPPSIDAPMIDAAVDAAQIDAAIDAATDAAIIDVPMIDVALPDAPTDAPDDAPTDAEPDA